MITTPHKHIINLIKNNMTDLNCKKFIPEILEYVLMIQTDEMYQELISEIYMNETLTFENKKNIIQECFQNKKPSEEIVTKVIHYFSMFINEENVTNWFKVLEKIYKF